MPIRQQKRSVLNYVCVNSFSIPSAGIFSIAIWTMSKFLFRALLHTHHNRVFASSTGEVRGSPGATQGYQCWVVSLGLDLCKDMLCAGQARRDEWHEGYASRNFTVYCAVTSHVLHFYKQQTNNSRASDMSSHNLGRSNSDLSSTTASLQPKKPSVAPNRYC